MRERTRDSRFEHKMWVWRGGCGTLEVKAFCSRTMARLSPDSGPLYLKSATVNAVVQRSHHPGSHVFKIQIEWTDGSSTTSYRGYKDFFDFQCGLIYAFPEESGQKRGSQRTLPFLPGKKLFRRSTRRLAEERLPAIDAYVQQLLAMPEHLTQSERVLQFFRSNWQEDRLRERGSGVDGDLGARAQTLSYEPAVKYSVQRLDPRGGYTNPITLE